MTTQATGTLFVITAASGTGKTSLVKQLLDTTKDLTVSISHTTRQPRPQEVDGVHYHFVDKDSFIGLIEQNAFFEHAEVFGNYYGTSKQAAFDELAQGRDVILEIDWQGALQVQAQYPQAVLIFILPPSKDALRQRLSGRATDSQEVIETRLAGAVGEMVHYDKFNYVVINDDFDVALHDLQSIINSQRLRTHIQQIRQKTLLDNLLSN